MRADTAYFPLRTGGNDISLGGFAPHAPLYRFGPLVFQIPGSALRCMLSGGENIMPFAAGFPF